MVKGGMMKTSSRKQAGTWPYSRHSAFERDLHKAVAAYFLRKGFNVQKKRSYILADRNAWKQNIILEEVANYIEGEIADRMHNNTGFPLHKFIHHGLSSQALLFNLIGPLIVSNDFSPLKHVLIAKDYDWEGDVSCARFEVEERSVFDEDVGQPTSIDLVIESKSDPTLFVEAKFNENGFGGCSIFYSGDCDGRNPAEDHSLCYLHHIGRRYWKMIEKYEVLNHSWRNSPICPLANFYQFFRELLFALINNGVFVLLYDERNPVFLNRAEKRDRGVYVLMNSMLPAHIKEKVLTISVQELFHAISDSSKYDMWTSEFAEKYGISVEDG